jgi:SH3-like domain-containing protein
MKNKIIASNNNHLNLAFFFGLTLAVTTFLYPVNWLTGATVTNAQEIKLTVRGSGLPVPRYVTLKSDEVNLRAGPGLEYPVLWQYRAPKLPVRVDAEFGIWRKIVDHDGTAGWMHGSVLSLSRMALIKIDMAKIHNSPDPSSTVIALAERNALMELQTCPKSWCRVKAENVRGWIKRQAVWGLLQTESLD